ncbi:hypothetical protein [Hymenobacter jejuensis]|uniref:DUF4148 domain-containing protein n=1 Tax=Hymenobacter jejuensis TaxID=2502781 RepID=A0A5B8A6D7_9BACT|nr:hypothetical protein [Hymenobacter jejuensis]QDA62295.1 hypothetical protein FHG12_20300 [Hymenobacter jejuensis]
MKKLPVLSALLFLVLGTASAQTTTPRVTAQQHAQSARIQAGVQSGELTRTEAARLKARQTALRNEKIMARADGRISVPERKELRRDEARTSRAIYRQKHDAQVSTPR